MAAAQELRDKAVPCRVHVKWLGVRKTLTDQQIGETALAFDADARLIGATKLIVDVRNPLYRKLTRIKSAVKRYWQEQTLPFPEPGIRLLTQAGVVDFDQHLQGFQHDLMAAEQELQDSYEAIKESSKQKLGKLFSAGEFPESFSGQFVLAWDYPNVEPPDYLMHLKPQVYEAECQRVKALFEDAVGKAEKMFAGQLLELAQGLSDKLQPGEDGRRKVFRDSAVGNLKDFFQKFRTLAVTDDQALREVVEQAEHALTGISPQLLRSDTETRASVGDAMATIAQRLGDMVGCQPRRAVVVKQPEPQMEAA